MIELSLVFLLIFFLGMFFLLVSLFLYMMIVKRIRNETRKKIEGYKETYRLDMFHFLQSGNEGSLKPDGSQEKFIALIELLNEYADVLDSEDIKQRISDFAKRYLTIYIVDQLKKKRWSLRMNALYSIEDFYMDHLVDLLHDIYNKKHISVTEKIQMLRLFAKFNDNKTVEYIKNVDSSISDFDLLTILSLFEEDSFNELVKDFDTFSKQMQYMIIETIGKKQYLHHHNLLEKLLQSDDEEMRIRTLKAYAYTGAPMNETTLRAFFSSSNWQVRMMAAKVAGARRLSVFEHQLITLLSDHEYVVRAEAAKAILQFKGGINMLKKVIEETTDRFARDMAQEWISKESGDDH
ncbi:hypothetical protein CJ195_02860 [Bacillus sp. UMB0899]|nr:hypothetical protein CJ195_02860 [Bacillus sp. UMB0899]